ncbi:ATP-binding cassette domain-containing protein [candidate division CSSED10-310 bacterium]|uniref:ATP-binding cassette domain-containing protein n=1 Tax=candidate division CSSED10-310 bacterium TaxID=2855610 RepID=A0ABV6YUI5_UNCC1
MTAVSILSIDQLQKQFRHGSQIITAVNQVTFSVEKAEVFGLVGPDGAGKTTTIRILCTVIPPDGGQVTLLDLDLVRQRQLIRRKIGYLSQKFSLYGDLTISENIDFFAEIHGIRAYEDRKQELLGFMRLDRFQDRLADRLSGGMKQKLALACTLIHKPEIIFLDEPTTGVDPVSRRDFWWILSTLQKEGLTIVISTPYLDEAERCHRVAFLNAGQIIRCDTPTNIKASLQEQLVEVSCSSIRTARRIIGDLPLVSDVQAFGDRLHVHTRAALEPEEITAALTGQQIEVFDVHKISPSLEDAFIQQLKQATTSQENQL